MPNQNSSLEQSTLQSSGLSSVTLDIPEGGAGEENIGIIVSALEDEAISIAWGRNASGWEVQWVFENPAPVDALYALVEKSGLKFSASDFRVTAIADTNWLEESYRTFPPFTVGDFFIFGSHFDGKIPTGQIPLQIDAATAFGSGEHGTTHGCLDALLYLRDKGLKPDTILDMGAGSGILAIAAYKIWEKPTLAVDIDKEATRVACHHRKINAVPAGDKGMICATGDGYAARRVVQNKKGYDLIIANILAGPLVIMANSLVHHLADKGYTILSGLLVEQEKDVLAAHVSLGLTIEKRITHGEWCTLILRKDT